MKRINQTGLPLQQEEEARFKGTPVTFESFRAWKMKFDREMAQKRNKEEEEKLKALAPKEREEVKKLHLRPTGQLLSDSKQRDHVFIHEIP